MAGQQSMTRWRGRMILASIALLILPLSACRSAFEVELARTEQPDGPTFRITETAHPTQPRYVDARVVDRDGIIQWRIETEPFDLTRGTATLTYGQAPPGFVTKVEAKDLLPEVAYVLVLDGMGPGFFRFHLDRDGRLLDGW